MEQTLTFFLKILNDSIHGRRTHEKKDTDMMWEKLIPYINQTGVAAIIAENLEIAVNNGQNTKEDQNVIEMYQKFAKKVALTQMGIGFALRRLQEEAEKRKITLVYFKGCILADLYPKYTLRSSSDSDIFAYKEQQQQTIQLLEELGYEWQEEGSKEPVPVYYNAQLNHKVELHFCLWEDYEGSRMRLLEKFELTKRDTLIPLTVCNGLHILSMEHTNHLIFQIFHIVKHFTVQGIGLRYVTDISLFSNHYKDEIHWDDFWKKIKILGYETFTVTLFSIAILYFELDSAVLCGRKCMTQKEIIPILEDLVKGGNSEIGWEIMGVMTSYLEDGTSKKHRNLKQLLKAAFPSVNELSDEYWYAKKHLYLLPAAWVHKGVGACKKRIFPKKLDEEGKKLQNVANHRIELIQAQDLVQSPNKTGIDVKQ